MMKANDFVAKAKEIATKYKTVYIMGCFGSPMNSTNKKRYTTNHSYNKQSSRVKKINSVSADTFGFDCVCLIKGILWGWDGNKNTTYGGAKYVSNGVPDVGADMMIANHCKDVSTNFSNIQLGEVVWMSGHIGIYIGDGLVVECTPIWKDGVQITGLKNLGAKSGYNNRTWTKHGKLKYIDYTVEKPKKDEPKKSIEELAQEVLDGKWGNGDDRVKALTKAGYDATKVQKKVNELIEKKNKPTFKVGDYVVPIKLVDYRGKKIYPYDELYQISKIDNRGATLCAVRGKQRPIWATLKLDNIKKKK